MKILVVLTGAMQFDGITNSVLNYYKAMDRTDMQIDILSARNTVLDMSKNFENIDCKVISTKLRDNHPMKYFFFIKNLIKKNEYDIVHAHGNSATLAFEMLAAFLAGCKVRIAHSRNSFCEHGRIDKILRPIFNRTYTDGFACGEKAGNWLFKDKPFTVISNGKEIDKFLFNPLVRTQYREKLGVEDDKILLGHVGLFHSQKNHPFLIDIFEQIAERSDKYLLVLIGDGDDRQAIDELVNKKGLSQRVIFLGRQTDVQNWLSALDIMVLPSLFEGMPNVVLEWQLSGLPAIISDNITKECGITPYVQYYSLEEGAENWAKKIMDVQINTREGTQAQMKQIFIDKGFDIDKNAETLKNIYLDLLKDRAGYEY